MAIKARGIVSRRAALAGFAASAASSAFGEAPAATAEKAAGPVFSPSGPNAERYGAAEGFPIADPALRVQPGEAHQRKYRIRAYSQFDKIYQTHWTKAAKTPE